MYSFFRFAYPVTLESTDEGVLVSFPDIPEALTSGADREEALAEAADCLLAGLGGYIQERRPLPVASPARGRTVIPLPALVSAKLALYQDHAGAARHERGPRTAARYRRRHDPATTGRGPPFPHRPGRSGARHARAKSARGGPAGGRARQTPRDGSRPGSTLSPIPPSGRWRPRPDAR